jgi:hypothetical protein
MVNLDEETEKQIIASPEIILYGMTVFFFQEK